MFSSDAEKKKKKNADNFNSCWLCLWEVNELQYCEKLENIWLIY